MRDPKEHGHSRIGIKEDMIDVDDEVAVCVDEATVAEALCSEGTWEEYA